MKTVCATIIICVLASGCARQKPNAAADTEAVKKTVEEYANALNSRDASAAVRMMSDKTYFSEMNRPASNGKEAIQKFLQEMFDRFSQSDAKFSAPVLDVQVDGELGAARGTWNFEARDKAGALAPVNESGSWALICRRQGDGSWKWDSVIINSDQPLPGTTANGSDEQALNQIEQDASAAMARAEKALGKLKPLYKLESVSIKDVKPQIYGDFALVKLTGEMKGKYNGKDQSGTLQGADLFVRRDGKWQVAYSQNTATVP